MTPPERIDADFLDTIQQTLAPYLPVDQEASVMLDGLVYCQVMPIHGEVVWELLWSGPEFKLFSVLNRKGALGGYVARGEMRQKEIYPGLIALHGLGRPKPEQIEPKLLFSDQKIRLVWVDTGVYLLSVKPTRVVEEV